MSEPRTKERISLKSLGGFVRVSAEVSLDNRIASSYRPAAQRRAAEEAGELLAEAMMEVLGAMTEKVAQGLEKAAKKDIAAAAKRAAARQAIDHAAIKREERGQEPDTTVDEHERVVPVEGVTGHEEKPKEKPQAKEAAGAD